MRTLFAIHVAIACTLLDGCAGALRAQTVHPPGVTTEVHAAIGRGTQWLVGNQGADGSWRNGGAAGSYPIAMTSLAGMSLLAGGSTPTRGKNYAAVRAAVSFLKRSADPDTGLFRSDGNDWHAMFGHGFATLFVASICGMEEDVREQETLQRMLGRACGLISAAQSAAGGWYYSPDANDDEGSVTVTQIQALRACRMAGIVVDRRTIDRAVDYIRRCQNKDGGIRYKLSGPSDSRPAITAAGVAVLYNAGIYDDQPFVEAAVRFCQKTVRVATDTTGHHFYTQHYWSQALWQRGGADWSDHYARCSQWLLRGQNRDGSWTGDGVGPVYGTAIALTILQLPYAYVPIYQR